MEQALRFSPLAWAKLLFLRDLGPTEVGGFAITSTRNPLCVTEFHLIQQETTSVTVRFDDAAVADFFDAQIDQGRRPDEFGRIWIHTHPGDSAKPSLTDEETFARVFGRADWAVMCILAAGGRTYVRLQFNAGPQGHLELPVTIDWQQQFPAADHAAWEAEYLACVQPAESLQFDPVWMDLADPGAIWDEFGETGWPAYESFGGNPER